MEMTLTCLELIFNTINKTIVTFYDCFDNRQLKGNILSIFIIVMEVAEATIRLS